MKKRVIEYRYRPSPGFILVCIVFIFTAFYFFWGMQKPDLDNLWFLLNKLKTGQIQKLLSDDRGIIFRSLEKHPDLEAKLVKADKILILSAQTDGYLETNPAYILRGTDPGSASLTFSLQGERNIWPVDLSINVFKKQKSTKTSITLKRSGIHKLVLKPTKEKQIIELTFTIKGKGLLNYPVMDTSLTVKVQIEKNK